MSKSTNGDSGLRRSAKNDSNENHDEDCGTNLSELYGTYTWTIERFQQIDKREVHSNVFEVDGYKWYVLMYPQGCDVCNHLSLFLCVANHDKLLPGWTHSAQFTLALVNKDLKKSKHSDTLHRFWKKEHDWGWKKFMELSKLQDGFIDDSGSIIIKAKVQVIRENVDRPFRCLDGQYWSELARVYLPNVHQTFMIFAKEKKSKFERLIEDKKRWSSLTAYWLGMDENTRLEMFREKKDVILKQVVKHFFIEKEVTSTLVIESLYSGLKSLDGEESRMKEEVSKLVESFRRILDSLDNGSKERRENEKQGNNFEKQPLARIVKVDKEVFSIVDDDVMSLLEKAVLEPFLERNSATPFLARGYREKVGDSYNIECEKLLTEFGRRILEIFVLDHIFFNKIEVAYVLKMRKQPISVEEEENQQCFQIQKKSLTKSLLGKDKSKLILLGFLF